MKRQGYQIGLMLEKREEVLWRGHTRNIYRVFSGRLHGPFEYSRRTAFWSWFKNWLITFYE